MNIKGYEVTEAQQQACLKAMGKVFKKADVVAAAIIAGVPEEHAELVAQRLLASEKRQGHIVFDVNVWLRPAEFSRTRKK